jgi:hypothetical protein
MKSACSSKRLSFGNVRFVPGKLLSGHVSMAVTDGLSEQDKAEGYRLACQAKIHGDVCVDA